MLKGYDPKEFFDEMFAPGGVPRRHYERLQAHFAGMSLADFDERRRDLDLAFLRQGITFNVYGD